VLEQELCLPLPSLGRYWKNEQPMPIITYKLWRRSDVKVRRRTRIDIIFYIGPMSIRSAARRQLDVRNRWAYIRVADVGPTSSGLLGSSVTRVD